MTEDDLEDIVGLGFQLLSVWSNLSLYYIMDESKLDETALKLLKVVEEKDTAIKELSNRLEGYYSCTRVLLERKNSNLVSGQVSGVDDNFGSYEINDDKLVRRMGLLESNLNRYFHK